jgi:hypothetical protein
MKRNLLLLLILFGTFNTYAQSYLILWNSINSNYQVQQVNPVTGTVTDLGTSSAMSSYYDLDEIYYDAANNQLVGLYQNTDLWKYNLANNTDQIIDLGSTSYSNLILVPTGACLTAWNTSTGKYEVSSLNLITGAISYLGSSSSVINSNTDLNKVYYDAGSNQLIGLYWGSDLWRYDLSTNTDQIFDIVGPDFYRSLTIANQKAYLIRWNGSNYEVKELSLTTGAVTSLGASTLVTSLYNINEVYYDAGNNQLVALHQYNSLWRYNLANNTDQLTSLGGADDYRDLAVYNADLTTAVVSSVNEKDDEVVKIFDMMGRELTTIEANKVLILQYKSGKTKKVFITE